MNAKAKAGTPGTGTTSGKTDDGRQTTDAGPDKTIVPESGVEGISAKIKAGMEKAAAGRQTPDDSPDDADKGDDADEGDDADKGEDTDEGEDADKGADADEGDKADEGKDADKDDDTDDDDADDPDLNEGKIKDGEIKGLAPEAQAKINQRIHEFNVKRKNAQAETDTAKARVTELEAKQGDIFIEVAKLGFAPDYVNNDEATKITRCDNLKAWNRWLGEHLGEDYEGSDPEKDPSMTAAQIKKMKAAVEEELMELSADVKSLRTTTVRLMQSDLARGRKARLAEEAGKTDDEPGKKKTEDGAGKKKVDPKPPKLSGANGATRRAPLSAGDKKPPAFDQKEFKEQGGNKTALVNQYAKIFGG